MSNSAAYLKSVPEQVRALSESIPDTTLLAAFTAIDTANSSRLEGGTVDAVNVPGIGTVAARDVGTVWGWLVDLVKSRHTDEWEAVNDAQYAEIQTRAAEAQGVAYDDVNWDLVPDEAFDGKPTALDNAVAVLTRHAAEPHRWAVVNIPVTRVLGTFATEAEAEAFNAGDPGAFVYELSDAEAWRLASGEARA